MIEEKKVNHVTILFKLGSIPNTTTHARLLKKHFTYLKTAVAVEFSVYFALRACLNLEWQQLKCPVAT